MWVWRSAAEVETLLSEGSKREEDRQRKDGLEKKDFFQKQKST